MGSKSKKGHSKKRSPTHSTLDQHKQRGKVLVPPMLAVPNLALMSWINDRLPELLWVALLFTKLERRRALAVIRGVADFYYKELRGTESAVDITHTGLSSLAPSKLDALLTMLCRDSSTREALSPLVLLNDLPASERWKEALSVEPGTDLWNGLKRAVGLTLYHQSQESTDCRWARVLVWAAAGRLHLPKGREDLAKEILEYPDGGDMRKVGPFIRATEGAFSAAEKEVEEWPQRFWAQCFRDTTCERELPDFVSGAPKVGTTPARVREVHQQLVQHCNKTRISSALEPKHEAVFGISLFCLSILQELLRIGVGESVLGRMGLRSVTECFITLSYLVKMDSPELWRTYRNYGTGQAKLAFLKLDRLGETEIKPGFASLETLKNLANDDLWLEFVPIDLGHWQKANLRNLSQDSGTKDVYDRYYDWTSGYVHGHWGAVRDVTLTLCTNSLHRAHRVPRDSARMLEDVVPDACECIDRLLGLVDQLYPSFPHRVSTGS